MIISNLINAFINPFLLFGMGFILFSDMDFKSEANEYKRMMNVDEQFQHVKKRQIGSYSDEEIIQIKQQIDDITKRLDQLETK